MMGVLAPAWLAAFAALAVPLAIHLWSPRARHPVRVGSIRLLTGIPPTATRSLRLRDWWLLALRLGVLAALVLSLAGVYWVPERARPATWALLSEDALAERALIDSLRDAGLELHLLEGGIPPLGGPALRSAGAPYDSGSPARPASLAPNVWSLLAEADRLAPAGTRFLVAAPLVADRFRGVRPALAATVTWRPVAARAAPAQPPPARARSVLILAAPGRGDDARYLEAAIRAAAAIGAPGAEVARAATTDPPPALATADWIAWLDEAPPPAAVVDRVRTGAVLFTQTGRDSVVTGGSPVRTAAAGPAPVLPRRAPFDGRGAALWTDGSGRPVLSVEREGGGLVYRLYGRLDAAGLALSPTFAVAIAELWRGSDVPDPPAPAITAGQALPATGAAPPARGAPPGAVLLGTPLWVIAAVAFAMERWLARRVERVGAR